MTTPRRRIVRSSAVGTVDRDRDRRLHKLRARLDEERAALARWLPRLKRSFHAVERAQLRITRLEREMARLEPSR